MDLSGYKRVHFIGIGGISMSGLAEILSKKGFKVSGSDLHASALTDRLSDLGIEVRIGQCAENIKPDVELVIYTAAVAEDNPELAAAVEMGLAVMDRAELLGRLMDDFTYTVCVAGSHGKTTTTSMVTEILVSADTDPTVSVGGILPSIGGNFRLGNSEYLVAEACEYRDSFLKFSPYVGIVLNIGMDHVDYFKDIEQLVGSFAKFARNIRPNGTLVINAQIPDWQTITHGLYRHVITFGTNDSDLYAREYRFDDNGCAEFEPVYKGRPMPRMQLRVPGEHNIFNALAAMAAAICLEVDKAYIYRALEGYNGIKRRLEIKGRCNGALVVDDYAHHPAEIKASLAAAKLRRHNKIWCVFQPHTYSRTNELLLEFTESFTDADEVIVVDIYAAREADNGLIHSFELARRINAAGTSCRYISGFKNVEKFLRAQTMPNDMLITMGAGDVYLVAEALVDESY